MDMSTKDEPKKTRGRPIVIERWWLNSANRHATGHSTTALATMLSDAYKRKPAWDRTTVSDFLKGVWTTNELMEAFCILFDMPPAYFTPRSYEEAAEMAKVARRHDGANPEKVLRLAELNKAREQLEKGVEDHTDPVHSIDGKEVRGRRRPRGMGGGGSSS